MPSVKIGLNENISALPTLVWPRQEAGRQSGCLILSVILAIRCLIT